MGRSAKQDRAYHKHGGCRTPLNRPSTLEYFLAKESVNTKRHVYGQLRRDLSNTTLAFRHKKKLLMWSIRAVKAGPGGMR